MLTLTPNQQCQSTEGKTPAVSWRRKLKAAARVFCKKVKMGVFCKKKWTFPERRVHYVQYQYFLLLLCSV